MTNPREKWIRFGCRLIGYNSGMLMACSELSKKRALRYTSALLIMIPLWAFIGFSFCRRYLDDSWTSCLIAAVLMIFLIIQIERQVILTEKGNLYLGIFRMAIGLVMALIGSAIIDQIIFKDDIEQKKLLTMDNKVKNILPGRAEELRRQTDEIDSVIQAKERERKTISDDLTKNPFVVAYETHVQKDTSKNQLTTTIRRQVHNPKSALLQPLDNSLTSLRQEKLRKDSILLSLRPAIEAELKANVGFLDELEVMYLILSESTIALFAWAIWFVFLLGLELFILVSKIGESENDYDLLMKQQMNLHFRRIELLRAQGAQ